MRDNLPLTEIIGVGNPVTVDYMLGWLETQGWSWAATKYGNEVTVRVIHIEPGDCAVHDFYAPTMFGAVAQAVRLVHDARPAGVRP